MVGFAFLGRWRGPTNGILQFSVVTNVSLCNGIK